MIPERLSFGNYLLSDKRMQNKLNANNTRVESGMKPLPLIDLLEGAKQVSHADLANFDEIPL